MSEAKIEMLERQLKEARKEYRDVTLRDAHKLVNAAAHSIEAYILDNNLYPSGPRAKFLAAMAAEMRIETENALGPQPGFSRRKTIPKRGQQ